MVGERPPELARLDLPKLGESLKMVTHVSGDGAKEAFDFAASPRHAGFGEHEGHFEFGTDLLQMV